MHKKHYIAIAKAIKAFNEQSPAKAFLPEHLDVLAVFFKENNAAFNAEKWLDYIAEVK